MLRVILTGCVLTALALPASADGWQPGLTHAVQGRFGVVYERDRATGLSATRPLGDVRYTATWGLQADNGWRFAVAVGVEAGDLRRQHPSAVAPTRAPGR